MPKEIEILYFALLREEAGVAREVWSGDCRTAGELYAEARERHGLSLDPGTVRLAVNDVFASADTELSAGDRVAFIPPVTGG